MKILLKKQKGITLIALVITIIVLLILAGVTIAMLTGQNGILTNAQKANMHNDYAQAEEKVRIAYMSVKTEIMTQKVANSSYNAQDNAGKLGKIVKDELNGSEWTVTPDGTDLTAEGTKIEIRYTQTSLKKDGISEGKPKQDGYVDYTITLATQDATLELETGTSGSTGDTGNQTGGNDTPAPGVYDSETGELLIPWDEVIGTGGTDPNSGTTYNLSNGLSVAVKGTTLTRVWPTSNGDPLPHDEDWEEWEKWLLENDPSYFADPDSMPYYTLVIPAGIREIGRGALLRRTRMSKLIVDTSTQFWTDELELGPVPEGFVLEVVDSGLENAHDAKEFMNYCSSLRL